MSSIITFTEILKPSYVCCEINLFLNKPFNKSYFHGVLWYETNLQNTVEIIYSHENLGSSIEKNEIKNFK